MRKDHRHILTEALAKLAPAERVDSQETLSGIAMRVIHAYGIDPSSHVTGNDTLLAHRSETYRVAFATALVEQVR